MRIEVVIADDHPLSREGIRQFLEMDADIHVVGEASNGLELLPSWSATPPART